MCLQTLARAANLARTSNLSFNSEIVAYRTYPNLKLIELASVAGARDHNGFMAAPV